MIEGADAAAHDAAAGTTAGSRETKGAARVKQWMALCSARGSQTSLDVGHAPDKVYIEDEDGDAQDARPRCSRPAYCRRTLAHDEVGDEGGGLRTATPEPARGHGNAPISRASPHFSSGLRGWGFAAASAHARIDAASGAATAVAGIGLRHRQPIGAGPPRRCPGRRRRHRLPSASSSSVKGVLRGDAQGLEAQCQRFRRRGIRGKRGQYGGRPCQAARGRVVLFRYTPPSGSRTATDQLLPAHHGASSSTWPPMGFPAHRLPRRRARSLRCAVVHSFPFASGSLLHLCPQRRREWGGCLPHKKVIGRNSSAGLEDGRADAFRYPCRPNFHTSAADFHCILASYGAGRGAGRRAPTLIKGEEGIRGGWSGLAAAGSEVHEKLVVTEKNDAAEEDSIASGGNRRRRTRCTTHGGLPASRWTARSG